MKNGFAIHELRTAFGKLRIEITNLLENCESTFLMILTFSCQITLLALHTIFAPLPLKHPSFPKLPLRICSTKLKYNLFHRQIKVNRTIMSQPFNNQCSHHIETSPLICSTNQLTGFYIMGTLVVKWFEKILLLMQLILLAFAIAISIHCHIL